MDGSVRLFRCILDSQVFAHPIALKIWIWCLCRASYKERYVSLKAGRGDIIVKLLPGQFIFGRYKAEEEIEIDGSTIYKWMQKFASENFDMISIESNNQYSIITINKWGEYQLSDTSEVTAKEQQKDSEVTAKEQQKNTNNKVNKVYNDFYDEQILLSENSEKYIEIVKAIFGENEIGGKMEVILKFKHQLSYEQFKKLMGLKTQFNIGIIEYLEKIENWGNPEKYTALYQTMLSFIRKDHPTARV
jgi:hypothetical protein